MLFIPVAVFLCVSSAQASHDITTTTAIPDTTSTMATPTELSYEKLLVDLMKVLENSSPGLHYLGDLPAYPATSCQQIAHLRPGVKSGLYWIQNNCCPTRVYCQMERSKCGEGVWMRVAYVNMTVPSANCPVGLQKVTTPKPSCRKIIDIGCSSVTFPTYGIPFTKVCGQVKGYQFGTPDAFHPFYIHRDHTLDDSYVDGISITHSSSPRQHIWTFTAAPDGLHANRYNGCPCTNFNNYRGIIPNFVGKDYFCETSTCSRYSLRYYTADPLWDGKGCNCTGNVHVNPCFNKEFSYPITSDVEVRVCLNEGRGNEDVLIEQLYLFVQ